MTTARPRPFGHVLALLFATALLSACGKAPELSAADFNTAYESALDSTSDAAILSADDEAAAMARLQDFFAGMTQTTVRPGAKKVYADDAILYDNLAVVYGLHDIEDYFVIAEAETDELAIEFLQVMNDGADYFVRWRMVIRNDSIASGEPIVSYGMSQFRFNAAGKVILHRDFWDAASGLYEYLPVVGGLVARLRGALTTPPDWAHTH